MRYTSARSSSVGDMQIQPGAFVPLSHMLVTPLVSIMCCVGKPRGHGRLQWKSADPRVLPWIESAFLEDAADRACAVEAMELAYELSRQRAMRGMIYYLWPGEKVLRNRKAIEAWIPRSTGSGYHPCGTVPMGAEGDPEAALDGRGRVRGMTGLWVADASIMPTIPSANTNLATLMIGERFGAWFRDGEM
jgi:choline dehydrogenase